MSLTQSSSFPGLTPSPARISSGSVIDDRLMHGIGYFDACTVTASPGPRTCDVCPSSARPAEARLRSLTYVKAGIRESRRGSSATSLTRRVIDDDDGKTRGRKERLRGQIGVSTRALREGWTIGPPADSEYAVEPVGVDTMSPSDCGDSEQRARTH